MYLFKEKRTNKQKVNNIYVFIAFYLFIYSSWQWTEIQKLTIFWKMCQIRHGLNIVWVKNKQKNNKKETLLGWDRWEEFANCQWQEISLENICIHFLESPFVKYEVILLEKSSGCWGESHKNMSRSHFTPNQENRTRHYILHDEVYFNFVYNN